MAGHSTPLPLIISLIALVPPSLLDATKKRASLLASHTEPYLLSQAFYTAEREAVPLPNNVHRRLRAQAISKADRQRQFKLQVLSNPLRGRGFEDCRVQSCAELDVHGIQSWDELSAFVGSLGFSKAAETQCQGTQYHLGLSLCLTITRAADARGDEPWIAELSTTEPVAPHLPLEATVAAMESVKERFRGLLEFARGPE